MAKLFRLFLGAALLFILASGVAYAQKKTATVHGKVEDPSGARISGTYVTLRNETTGTKVGVRTDANGEFIVRNVPLGKYTVEVTREGFHRLTQTLLVLTGGTNEVEFHMVLASVSTSVDVRASRTELLDTLSPGAVTVVYPDDTKGEFKSLPDLLDEIPGVYVRRVSGNDNQYTTASIRGGAPTEVNIYVDGVPFNLASEVAADLSTFPINNVERIEVYRGEVPARFSGAPVGGAINIVTKQPTNWALTTSAGARTLGGRRFSFALNGPLWHGKFLFGGDLDKTLGDFSYTDFFNQQINNLVLPANSYWGAVPYCQATLTGTNNTYVSACGRPINKTRLNDSSTKENLITKWQTDRFSAKWSYLYMNRKLPYPTDQDPQVDDPSAIPQYLSPRYQILHQTEGVLGWNEHHGNLTTSLTGNVMDQDKQYYWQSYPLFHQFGGQHSWYHTRRYGAEADASYDLASQSSIAQRFEFHGDWVQEMMNTMIANTSYSGVTGIGFPPSVRRHTLTFQLQDTITLRFLHNLEITPVGRMQRLTGPVMGNIVTPFASTTGDLGWKPTGSIAVKERFGHGWQAFATYGRYVRYPNLYEIYGDSIYVIPRLNSDGSSIPLQSESGRTIDIGAGWDGAFTKELSGHTRLTLFHRQTDNNITLEQTPIYSYYENTGDTINRGIEIEENLHYRNLVSLQTAATIQDGYYTGLGFFAHDTGMAIFPAAGWRIPTLNSPYGTGDARLDLHALHGGILTTFFEVKYVGQNPMNISTTAIRLTNGQIANRYDGRQQYERPLTTLDMGIHLKLPHGGTFSSGVTDLLNQGPNQTYGGYIVGIAPSNIAVTWYTCSSTGVKYQSNPSPSDCPSNDVIASTASVRSKQNLWYPQQGRTVYVLMSWDFTGWHPRRK